MTLEEIIKLDNINLREDNHFVYINPNEGYYLEIEDYPENSIIYDSVRMLKQDNYSTIYVVKFDKTDSSTNE